MKGGRALTRRVGFKCSPLLAAPLVALVLLAATGCSGEPKAAVSAADQHLSPEEIAALRKSAKSPVEFRELLRMKLAERKGAVVTTKSSAGKRKSKKD